MIVREAGAVWLRPRFFELPNSIEDLMRIAIYALTRDGADTAAKIHDSFADERDPSHEVTLYLPERYLEQFHAAAVPAVELGKIIDLVAESFSKFDAHIFVTAAGIAVRSIALHLNDKTTDPAVVVLDQYGKHVVSLLAGHLGGRTRFRHRSPASQVGPRS